jgi:hypothetical protein
MIQTRIIFNGSKIRLIGFGIQRYQMALLGQFAVDTVKARVARGVGSDDVAMKPLVGRYAAWKQNIGLQPMRDLHGPGMTTYSARTYVKNAAEHLRTYTGPLGEYTKGWRNGLVNPYAFNATNRIGRADQRAYITTKKDIRFRSSGGGAHMLDNFTVRSASESTVRMDLTQQWARDRARANEQRSPWFGFSPNDVRAITLMAQQIFKAMVTDMAVRLHGEKGGSVWMNPFGSQSEMLRKVA